MNNIETPIRQAAAALREAERPLRILGLLAWPLAVRERFLASNGEQMPDVTYERADTRIVEDALTRARPIIRQTGPAQEWFERIAERIATANQMLNHVGQHSFYQCSSQLYGAPDLAPADSGRTPLELARRLRRIIDRLSHVDLGAPADPSATADEVAKRMQKAVKQFFADEAPAIEVVDNLSANATAGPERIRIRATARFTDRDVEQLIHHEAGIHVTTSLNGRHQDDLPILAASHPGTTRTQEGLAVFAEFITGCMDLDRLSRLADRVLGIQMAAAGADFIEVYRHFLEQIQARDGTDDANTELTQRKAAFEQTRRVFRGGVLDGGAPFTKDVVYLDGLLRVHDFLRSVVAAGRADVLMLLFCGKLDLDDIPVLGKLADRGLLKPPRFLPSWAADRRFLVSYLAYSGFLGRVSMGKVHERYTDLLQHVPEVRFSA